MRKYQRLSSPVFYLLLLFVIGACNSSPRNIPFPAGESEFAQPATNKLTFGEPGKIEWIQVHRDSSKPTITRFNFNSIPSKPLDIAYPIPITLPVKDTTFDWKNIPDTVFNIDAIPSQPIRFKTTLLGQPRRVKSSQPRLKDGASESLLLFGQDQGLPGTIASFFVQDKNGIMWVATDNGLCRFDGEYCETYSPEQGLGFSWTTRIFEDSKGQIWMCYNNNSGLTVLNKKTGLLKHMTTTEGLVSNRILCFAEDDSGRVWIGTGRGIQVIDEKTGTMKLIKRENGLSGNFIQDIIIDSQNRYWLAIPGRGIDIIDMKGNVIKHYGTSAGLGDNNITCLTEDVDGQIWAGTFSGGLHIINERKGYIKQLTTANGLAGNRVSRIAQDKNGILWIGVYGGGVDLYNPNDETIKNLSTNEGLSNDNVFATYVDKQGQVWIGTNGGEVNIYNTNGGDLQHLTSARGLSNKTGFYYAFTEDSLSQIWVGSSGIADVIDPKKQTIRSISKKEGLGNAFVNNLFTDTKGRIWISNGNIVDVVDIKNGTIQHYGKKQGIASPGQAGEITEDRSGQVWISGSTVTVIDENSGNIKYAQLPPGFSTSYYENILIDKKGRVWLGSINGIKLIDEKAGTIREVTSKDFNSVWIYSLTEDSQGNIWFGTSGRGLLMIDPDAGTLTNFTVADGLEDMQVYSVNERNGFIYAGTGKGLAIIAPVPNATNTKMTGKWEVKNYGKPQGFLRVDHNPRSLLSKDGRLWWGIADVLTIMGEPRIDSLESTTYLTSIDIMDQAQNFVANKWVQKQLHEADTIWSLARDTFYTKKNFPVDSGYSNKNNIRWDSTIVPYNIPVRLSLPFGQNHLTFHFTGTHLDNLNKTRYRYVLEGIDHAWSGISDKPYADYRNLSHGKYTFKVSARGFNGKWSKPLEFRFTIRPPWWLSIWAYIFYGLCLVAIIVTADAILRHRLLQKERERTREKELAQAKEIEKAYTELKTTQAQLIQSEKMASLGELTAGIAHEIQNPLNFVNNFSDVNTELIDEMQEEMDKGNMDDAKVIAKNIKENEQKINHHGKRADSIVKGMLQHSRNSSGQKEPTDINALADECMRLSYHGLRAKDKSFNAKTETHFDSSIPKINIAPQDIGRVVLNLFTNAFYSVMQKKKQLGDAYEPVVSVKTNKTSKGISISIRDNGNGVPQKVLDKIFQPFFTTKPVGEGTGLGLSMSYEIITKGHNGELKVNTKEGEFAEFIINLPL